MKIPDISHAYTVDLRPATVLFVQTKENHTYAFPLHEDNGTARLSPRTQHFGNHGDIAQSFQQIGEAFSFVPEKLGATNGYLLNADREYVGPYKEISLSLAKDLLNTLPPNTPLEEALCATPEDTVEIDAHGRIFLSEFKACFVEVTPSQIKINALTRLGTTEVCSLGQTNHRLYIPHEENPINLGHPIPTELGKFLLKNWKEVQIQRSAVIDLLKAEGVEIYIPEPTLSQKWEKEKTAPTL
jgi:hypothetical protein